MKQIILVVDCVLDQQDMDRLDATAQPHLYQSDSNELYLKHLKHVDYHHPNLVLTYDKNYEIHNLQTGRVLPFYINNEGLRKPIGVALGVTDHLALIALGDTDQTKIQVVDVDQTLNVFLNTTYFKDSDQLFPIPKLFSGNPKEAQLIYYDGSTLSIDLEKFETGDRQKPTSYKPVRKILSPYLSILGPFVLLHITPEMDRTTLHSFRLLIKKAMESPWLSISDTSIINSQLAPADFDETIKEKEEQYQKILSLLDTPLS